MSRIRIVICNYIIICEVLIFDNQRSVCSLLLCFSGSQEVAADSKASIKPLSIYHIFNSSKLTDNTTSTCVCLSSTLKTVH